MKIQVLSDLHLEFYNDEDGDGEDGSELRDMLALPPLVDGTDVLCLLGELVTIVICSCVVRVHGFDW